MAENAALFLVNEVTPLTGSPMTETLVVLGCIVIWQVAGITDAELEKFLDICVKLGWEPEHGATDLEPSDPNNWKIKGLEPKPQQALFLSQVNLHFDDSYRLQVYL